MTQPADLATTTVTLDRERTLRMDYDALELLSGLSIQDKGGDRSPLDIWRLASGLDVNAMAVMLYVTARHEDSALTVKSTKRILRHALRMKVTTWKRLNDALDAAMKSSEVLGLFQPDAADEDDGDAPGNPPGPAPASVMRTSPEAGPSGSLER